MSKVVKTPRNLLCEIGPLNGDREEKNTPFSGETSTTPFDAVYLKTDPFRRFFERGCVASRMVSDPSGGGGLAIGHIEISLFET